MFMVCLCMFMVWYVYVIKLVQMSRKNGGEIIYKNVDLLS